MDVILSAYLDSAKKSRAWSKGLASDGEKAEARDELPGSDRALRGRPEGLGCFLQNSDGTLMLL
jgi:hypothetical protein